MAKGQKGKRAKGQWQIRKVENYEKDYYLKLEDFEILTMFGECVIDVTNSKVKIELDWIGFTIRYCSKDCPMAHPFRD